MINVVGDIFGTTGYAIHTRELLNALSKITEVRITTQLIPGWEQMVSDKELEMIKRPPSDEQINLIITTPWNWKLYTKQGRNWAYCIWEGDKVPLGFIEEFMNPEIEYIFVASNHTKEAILNTLDSLAGEITYNPQTKIKVIPHGVDLNKFYPKEFKREKFTFLCNKGLRNLEDRGGIQYLIKAYLEEFKPEENVELIVKVNPAYGTPDLQQMFPELTGNIPQVTYVKDNIPYDKLVELYKRCDVFVSPTRSEAFNIPCMEAFACGKPVITTNFGGQTDYCNNENSWIIDGELTEVKHDIIYEGIKWLTPNHEALKSTLRLAYNKPEEVISKGIKALETARKYTWDNTVNKIRELK